MAFGFDKEMDFLLREAARQNDFELPTAHLDADDFAAFVEASLPETARLQFIAHLADCSSCRTHLSDLILLSEAEEQEEAATVVETNQTVKPVQPSWLESFKRLFAIPTLGYASAALVVLILGAVAFVGLRSRNETSNVTVARVEQVEQNVAQPPPTAEAPAATASAPELRQTPTIAAESAPRAESQNAEPSAEAALTLNNYAANASLPPSVTATRDANSNNRSIAPPANAIVAARSSSNQATNSTASGSVNNSATARSRSNSQTLQDRTRPESAAPNRSQEARRNEASQEDNSSSSLGDIFGTRAAASNMPRNLRMIDDKMFKKTDGVWQDSACKTQNARTILRSSKDYKKLDANLRALAERFKNEEVIIVWQGKAYKIK